MTLLINIIDGTELVQKGAGFRVDEENRGGSRGRGSDGDGDQVGVEVLEQSRAIAQNTTSRRYDPWRAQSGQPGLPVGAEGPSPSLDTATRSTCSRSATCTVQIGVLICENVV